MKIYTKTGDKGKTSLIGGKKVFKDDSRIEAYGNIDEVNAFVGMLKDHVEDKNIQEMLYLIQNQLFVIGSVLATQPGYSKMKLPELKETDVIKIENEIDAMNSALPDLTSFILPGGNKAISICHITRTVCRRAERAIVRLNLFDNSVPPIIIKYINRLSDYFFVLSRKMADDAKINPIKWKPF